MYTAHIKNVTQLLLIQNLNLPYVLGTCAFKPNSNINIVHIKNVVTQFLLIQNLMCEMRVGYIFDYSVHN